MKGDEWPLTRGLGEGLRGIRPPAVLEEKSPWWLFTGVDAVTEAMVIYDQSRCKGSTPIEDAIRINADQQKSMQLRIVRLRKKKERRSGDTRINRR